MSDTIPTPQIAIPFGIMNDPDSPTPDGGGPFPIRVGVFGLTDEVASTGARLWLYKYNQSRRTTRGRERRFTHPSSGAGLTPQFTNWSGGAHHSEGGNLVRAIQTEWDLPVGDSYTTVTIDPNDWYRGPIVFPVTALAWNGGTQYGQYGQASGTTPGSRKTVVFAFRVVVRDPASPDKPIFGPFSGRLLLSPRFNGSAYTQWQIRTRQT